VHVGITAVVYMAQGYATLQIFKSQVI